MNYQHIYHAGSFADVFKHCVLISLLQAFFHKEKPILYLDTHAGMGRYDLRHKSAQTTQEYADGIGKIYQQKNPPKVVQDYLAIVKSLNPAATSVKNAPLYFYPGSPAIAQAILRPSDRLVLAELQPTVCDALRYLFHHDKRIAVHQQDGYQLLNALVPPAERRGLVFIDPPYEQRDEMITIRKWLKKAMKKWPTGVYAVWYPIKSQHENALFLAAMQRELGYLPMLTAELSIYPQDVPIQLNGSGVLIINPPWQLENKLAEFLPWLWQQLTKSADSHYELTWLSPRQ
jgi:23S rRNA (adenine2030-N6)-methyltransferase